MSQLERVMDLINENELSHPNDLLFGIEKLYPPIDSGPLSFVVNSPKMISKYCLYKPKQIKTESSELNTIRFGYVVANNDIPVVKYLMVSGNKEIFDSMNITDVFNFGIDTGNAEMIHILEQCEFDSRIKKSRTLKSLSRCLGAYDATHDSFYLNHFIHINDIMIYGINHGWYDGDDITPVYEITDRKSAVDALISYFRSCAYIMRQPEVIWPVEAYLEISAHRYGIYDDDKFVRHVFRYISDLDVFKRIIVEMKNYCKADSQWMHGPSFGSTPLAMKILVRTISLNQYMLALWLMDTFDYKPHDLIRIPITEPEFIDVVQEYFNYKFTEDDIKQMVEDHLLETGTWDTVRYLLNKHPVKINRDVLNKRFVTRRHVVYPKLLADIWKSQFDNAQDFRNWLCNDKDINKMKDYVPELYDI